MGAGPYPTAAVEVPRVRQSTLAGFASCPLSANLNERYGSSSHRAGGGTLLHRAIARCLQYLELGEEPSMEIEVAMDIFEEVQRQADMPMTAEPLADVDVVVSPRELADMRVSLRQWCRQLTWDPRMFVGIERREDIVVTYPDGEGGVVERLFTTQLDHLLLSGNGEYAESWDWKSSKSPPKKRERDPEAFDDSDASEDGFFQQRAHALVIFTRWPRVQTVRCVEYYPRAPDDPVRERTFHRYELPQLQGEFSAYMERFDKAYESQAYEALGGTHCSYCAAPAKCTLFPFARREGEVTNPEEAAKAMGQAMYLKALAARKVDSVNSYCRATGDIVPVRTPKGMKAYGPTSSGVIRLHDVEKHGHPHDVAVDEELARMEAASA